MAPVVLSVMFAYLLVAMAFGTISWPLCLWKHKATLWSSDTTTSTLPRGYHCERCGKYLGRQL